MTYIVSTVSTRPNRSSFNELEKIVYDAAEFTGDNQVYVVDGYERYWRWGRWQRPFASNPLDLRVKLGAGLV